jgi:RND family efflux transporter MFP subunit
MVESYIDGTLETLHVKEGDHFAKDQLLVSMDASIQVLVVEVARLQSESNAEVDAAEARVIEAQAELDSQNELAKTGSATPREIRQAEARLIVAKADLQLAAENKRLAVKQYEIERERLELYDFMAPFSGRVVAVATAEGAEEGAALRQNDPIMHLVQINPLIARISLPEEVVDQLKVGSIYPVGVGRGKKSAQAKLTHIASVVDRGSQLIEVVFEIPNRDRLIRSGVRCRLLDVGAVSGELAKE